MFTFLKKTTVDPLPSYVNPDQHVWKHKPVRTGSMSLYPYSEEIEALFRFKTNFEEIVDGAIRTESGTGLWVPREAVPYADAPNDYRVSYPAHAIDCNFVPRPGQAELIEQSLKYLQQGRSHILESPTGSGKTWLGTVIAARMGQPTIFVVTKEDLTSQWRDTFTKAKIPPQLIGHIQADVCDWQGKMFVTAMVQSLIIEGKFPPEMFQYFGLVVLDEVHQMAADCFIRTCQKFSAKYRLGLSATPNRKDGKTRLLHWHIGPTLVRGNVLMMKPKVLVRQTGWRIPEHRKKVQNAWVWEKIPHAPGRMMLVTKAQASNTLRNMEIVNFAVQAYKADRRCLIMSDLREAHLDPLFHLLCQQGVPGNDIGYYVGQMSKMQLSLSKVKRIILGTYKMCSTGTDVPEWDSLVLATPHADIKQAVGRVLRSKEGKKQPVVLDLVDFDPIFQNFYLSRLKQYYSLGAEVIPVA